MIRFLPTTSLFLHHFWWLTPHFAGNHNIFLSYTILLKTQKFKIFMNMFIPGASWTQFCVVFETTNAWKAVRPSSAIWGLHYQGRKRISYWVLFQAELINYNLHPDPDAFCIHGIGTANSWISAITHKKNHGYFSRLPFHLITFPLYTWLDKTHMNITYMLFSLTYSQKRK